MNFIKNDENAIKEYIVNLSNEYIKYRNINIVSLNDEFNYLMIELYIPILHIISGFTICIVKESKTILKDDIDSFIKSKTLNIISKYFKLDLIGID